MLLQTLRKSSALALFPVLSFLISCNSKPTGESSTSLSPAEARQIAKEAYIYGFPMAANYQTMYKQAIDTTSRDYRGPFNTINSSKSVATPEDKFVVTPNSDTPYSYLWMDLRAEPIIVNMPRIEPNRYYTGQMVDLYTYNFAYLGTRAYGNDGGTFMIVGPGWNGPTPPGIKAVIHSETEFAYLLFRTQLFNAADLPKVNKIQSGYHAQPLSEFLHQPATSGCTRRQLAQAGRHRNPLSRYLPHRQLRLPVLPGQPVGERISYTLRQTQHRPRPDLQTSAASPPRSSRPSTTASRTPTPTSSPS